MKLFIKKIKNLIDLFARTAILFVISRLKALLTITKLFSKKTNLFLVKILKNLLNLMKSKKILIPVIAISLFFLLTPISIHQVNKKIAKIINTKAQNMVEDFEKQVGLNIHWEKLQFKILSMNIHLKDVTLSNAHTNMSKKNKLLNYLNGQQFVKDIYIRPHLLSLILKKDVLLSKVKISNGNINLQALKQKLKTSNHQTDFHFPIKKLVIKNGSVVISHNNQKIKFLKINLTLSKKTTHTYRFHTFIEETHLEQENPFSLRFRGSIQKNKILAENLIISNKQTQANFEWINFHFEAGKLKEAAVKGSGILPFSFINKSLNFFGEQAINFQSLISYKLNLKFDDHHGYRGNFHLSSDKFRLKGVDYKSYAVRGGLLNKTAFIDSGFIKTQLNSLIKIKKIGLLFKSRPMFYDLSVETENLELSFLLKKILNIQLPLNADLKSSIECSGSLSFNQSNCDIKAHSRTFSLMGRKNKIVSFYGMNTVTKLKWKNKYLNFKVLGTKNSSSRFEIQGNYNNIKKTLAIKASGDSQIPTDIKFNRLSNIKTNFKLTDGSLKRKKGDLQITGKISTPLLKANDYIIRNVKGDFKLKNDKLVFKNIEGSPGQTNYKASYAIDFKKQTTDLNINFSFLNLENLRQALKLKMKWPIETKGTGTAVFSMKNNLKNPKNNSFQMQGNLFNTYLEEEFFKNIGFNIFLNNGEGFINHLLLKSQGSGSIALSGRFDNKFKLNLDLKGENLRLASINFLNKSFPFNQSGVLSFDMGVKGVVTNPELSGSFNVTNALLYSFPVNNIRSQIKINKKGVLISDGNIIDEFIVKKFYYPFFKKSPMEIEGEFNNLDFVKILLAKNKKENNKNYYSKLNGRIDLKIDKYRDQADTYKNKRTGRRKGNQTPHQKARQADNQAGKYTDQQTGRRNPKQKTWQGKLTINDVVISKKNKWIKSTKPFSVTFLDSAWILTASSFKQHNNNYLHIRNAKNNKLNVTGDASLSLFSLLFPYLKNLKGEINLNALINKNIKLLHPQGTMKIKKGVLSIENLPTINEIQSSLQFDGSHIKISNTTGLIGGGSGSVSGSVFYNFKDSLSSNLFIKFKNSRFNIPKDFSTQGDGWIQIKGKKAPYLIKGQYSVNSGKITKEFSGLKNNLSKAFFNYKKRKSKKTYPFNLDLNVLSNDPIHIKNNLLNAFITGETKIVGPTSNPLLTGAFNILTGDSNEKLISFKDQEFKITSGSVKFNNSSPNNPLIDIKAKTVFTEKVIDSFESNQETSTDYQIFLTVNGLAKDLKITLASLPSINEKEIISMLTLGMSSKHFDANVKQNITGYSYQLLGSFLLQKSLNKEVSNILGLNLNISPHINILNEPVTKITFRKTWFDRLKTSFSRTIEEFPASDVRLRYDLKPSVSLTAFWENTEHIEVDPSNQQKMGLDVEFNFDF